MLTFGRKSIFQTKNSKRTHRTSSSLIVRHGRRLSNFVNLIVYKSLLANCERTRKDLRVINNFLMGIQTIRGCPNGPHSAMCKIFKLVFQVLFGLMSASTEHSENFDHKSFFAKFLRLPFGLKLSDINFSLGNRNRAKRT